MRRVRVQGDLYHGRVPEGAVYVGRGAPGLPASPYRNPFKLKDHGVDALRLYAEHLDAHPELVKAARRELVGHDLACWCKLDQPCHADELLRRIAPWVNCEKTLELLRAAAGTATPEVAERCLAHLQPEPCPTCAAYIAAGL